MLGLVKPLGLGSIMYRVVRAIAMFVVLAHLACGCCLHHAHAYGSQPSDTPPVETTSPCGHHGHEHGGGPCHHQPSDHQPSDHQPCDHQPCDHGCDHDQCVFARIESGGTSQVSIDAFCVPLVSVIPIPPPVDGIDSSDKTPHHLGPPIPLHLLNQTLLL